MKKLVGEVTTFKHYSKSGLDVESKYYDVASVTSGVLYGVLYNS